MTIEAVYNSLEGCYHGFFQYLASWSERYYKDVIGEEWIFYPQGSASVIVDETNKAWIKFKMSNSRRREIADNIIFFDFTTGKYGVCFNDYPPDRTNKRIGTEEFQALLALFINMPVRESLKILMEQKIYVYSDGTMKWNDRKKDVIMFRTTPVGWERRPATIYEEIQLLCP